MGHFSVEIRDLLKSHGSTVAVEHCSFSVKRGEFFSLLGPSGSGKTTVLRLLAGFERPDGGEILIEGRSMRGVPPNQRPVNLVFQHYALFPHLTVFRNVSFGLEMRRLPAAEIRRRVESALDMVRLADKHARFPAQLSGGEQQRVALARALVNRPAVVLLDEPLGALDQQLRRDMQIELKAIQEQVGLTFICVTHHQEEALTMSDRIAVMRHGRILQVGPPREIYESPVSRAVARFVGTANECEGRVDQAVGPHCRIVVEGLPVLRATHPGLPIGSRVVLILRPERVSLAREAAPEFDNCMPGRVEKAVYNGGDMHYWIRVSPAVVWEAHVANLRADQKVFVPGEPVYVHWNAGDGIVLTE
ncbi:ABC transporter ATP-binding protein [Candidatus Nitrospira bockiana]